MREISKVELIKIFQEIQNGKDFEKIASDNGIPYEEFYPFITSYCTENHFTILPKGPDGKRSFAKEVDKTRESTRSMPKLFELKEWCDVHQKVPGMSARDKEVLTPEEQEEIRMASYMSYLGHKIVSNYDEIEDTSLIDDEYERTAVKIYREVNEKYNTTLKYKLPRQAIKLETWSMQTGFKPEKIYKKDDELTAEDREELEMYMILMQLRMSEDNKNIPESKRKMIKQVIKKQNSMYSKTDMEFIESLKTKLENPNIELMPIEVEIIRSVINGDAFKKIAQEKHLSLRFIYDVVDSFCSKYKCKLVSQMRSGNSEKRVFILDDSKNNETR